MGDAGIFSFGLYKNVNSFKGGAIVTNNKKLEIKLRNEISRWSIFPKYNYSLKK